MGCDECREAISAQLDGEDLPGEPAAIAAHLETCGGCRVFAERAARVTRLTRTRAVEPVPDLAAAVVAAVPRRRPGTGAVRFGLGAIGISQFAVAATGVLGVDGGHHGIAVAGASVAHLAHEGSAWNLALAVGFLWAATTTSRPAGLVPLVAAFVGVLTALSAADVVAGNVDAGRLLTHGLVVTGLVLLVVLQRRTRGDDGGGLAPPVRGLRAVTRGRHDRRPPRDDGLAPTARHRAA